ncbi:UbiX family flavin prenyltransferase [Hymenobacter terrenus]|uniref:UbiX family flavin prenyltransferase n=1 Tax=Hymenobacter terrenus TaxID=1629124 RepID=UPI000619EF39|nr:UbiX family flavin prenyltransferase [Hymenobacter terrenus]
MAITPIPDQVLATSAHRAPRRRLIVGISGATGVVYAIRLLQLLREADIETHLVVSKPGEMTRAYETEMSAKDLRALADVSYSITDVGAAISSGSFKTMGMVVAPCSIRTLSEIATGVTSSLLTRAADVVLKERRRLVLLVRETPLHAGHLKSMLAATENGAIIAPPVPAFYTGAQTIDDLVDHTVGRVLDLFDIDTAVVKRWGEGDGLRMLGKALQAANGFDSAAQL